MRIETWESDGYMNSVARHSSPLPGRWVNKEKKTLGCEILRTQIGGLRMKLMNAPGFGGHVKICASSEKRSFSCRQAHSRVSLCERTATDLPLPKWRHFSAVLVRKQLFIRQHLTAIISHHYLFNNVYSFSGVESVSYWHKTKEAREGWVEVPSGGPCVESRTLHLKFAPGPLQSTSPFFSTWHVVPAQGSSRELTASCCFGRT